METPDISDLRVVGGNVALDFVNTVDEDIPGGDYLVSREHFAAWLRRVGLNGGEPIGRTTLREVHSARNRIDAVLRPVAAGGTPAADDLAALRRLEHEALATATLAPDAAGFAWEWPAARPLAPIIHAATELLLHGPISRLRMCGNCTWLFLDDSRNGSRRWCSMESCGTEVKVRRLTERRRERRSG